MGNKHSRLVVESATTSKSVLSQTIVEVRRALDALELCSNNSGGVEKLPPFVDDCKRQLAALLDIKGQNTIDEHQIRMGMLACDELRSLATLDLEPAKQIAILEKKAVVLERLYDATAKCATIDRHTWWQTSIDWLCNRIPVLRFVARSILLYIEATGDPGATARHYIKIINIALTSIDLMAVLHGNLQKPPKEFTPPSDPQWLKEDLQGACAGKSPEAPVQAASAAPTGDVHGKKKKKEKSLVHRVSDALH